MGILVPVSTLEYHKQENQFIRWSVTGFGHKSPFWSALPLISLVGLDSIIKEDK